MQGTSRGKAGRLSLPFCLVKRQPGDFLKRNSGEKKTQTAQMDLQVLIGNSLHYDDIATFAGNFGKTACQ
jgi:hypothetical protein